MKKYLFIAVFGLLLISGCQTSPLLKSCIAVKDTIVPEFINYVKNDPKLTDKEKKYRIQNATEFKRLIEVAEKGGEE